MSALKRRIIAILLIVCLCIGLVAVNAGASSGICFIALNDDLLELSSPASASGAYMYVPYTVFASMGLYCSFFTASDILLLYDSNKQIYFEIDSGNTYDSADTIYPVSARVRNGQVYVPAKFVCEMFGYTYSYISGKGYGDIVRITDGSAILDDANFLKAARSLMLSRYEDYISKLTGTAPERTPGPTPETTQQPGAHSGTPVYLSFTGLPDRELLGLLDRYSAVATFFVTAEQVLADPDMLRRTAGEGHGIGLLFDPDDDGGFGRASDIVFEAARIKTALATARTEDAAVGRDAAEAAGLVWCQCGIDAALASAWNAETLVAAVEKYTDDRADVRLECGRDMPQLLIRLLQYLVRDEYSFRVLRETNVLEETENE